MPAPGGAAKGIRNSLIMKDLFISINRAVTALVLLLVCGALSAQVQTLPTMRVAGRVLRYYDVQKGENVYTVAEKLGLTRDQIIENNPSAADGLSAGMRLYFPGDMTSKEQAEPQAPVKSTPLTHVVQKGETVYGIAMLYDIPVEQIVRLNPQADAGLSPGLVLALDDSALELLNPSAPEAEEKNESAKTPEETAAPQSQPEAEAEAETEATETPEEPTPGKPEVAPVETLETSAEELQADTEVDFNEILGDDNAAEANEAMSVAILLPFMANEENPSRAAQLNREFLRGLLMAAKDLAEKPGAKIYLRTYDTANDIDTLRALMEIPQVSGADIIVVPDAESQMALIENSDTRARLLNYFSVKDETYRNHSNVIQANIPHHDMYEKTLDAFMERYIDGPKSYQPVFLSRRDGATDKAEFVNSLKKRLTDRGITFREIEFDQNLEESDLADINPTLTPVVYIPVSGSRNEFGRFSPALQVQKSQLPIADDIALFGYPEWVTFRGEYYDALGNLNTTIYSRFFSDDNDPNIKQIRERYRQWYGEDMSDTFPRQGILGYDAGTCLIDALRAMSAGEPFPDEFEGIQNTLSLQRASDDYNAGLVNRSLFLIHYLPGRTVERTRI